MGRPSDNPNPIELVWEAPATEGYAEEYEELIKQVKAKPGTWARLRLFPGESGAYATKKRLQAKLNYDTRWQLTVSRHSTAENPRERGLYLRYRTQEQMSELPARRRD
jgi:hypothetical protein